MNSKERRAIIHHKLEVMKKCYQERDLNNFDLFYDTDDYLVKFPRNINVEDISPIFTFEKTSQNIFNLASYGEVIDRLRIYTPYQIMVSNRAESSAFESIYNRHIRWFAEMKNYYGINS